MPKSTNWCEEFIVLLVRTIGYGFWAACLTGACQVAGRNDHKIIIGMSMLIFGLVLILARDPEDQDPVEMDQKRHNYFFIRPVNTMIWMVGAILAANTADLPTKFAFLVLAVMAAALFWQDPCSPRWIRGILAVTGSIAAVAAIRFAPSLGDIGAYFLTTAGVIGLVIAFWQWRKPTPASNPSPTS